MEYLMNNSSSPRLLKPNKEYLDISVDIFLTAVNIFDQTIANISNIDVNLFEILGLRNLSSLVGEVYVKSFAQSSNGLFIKNPNQDGYPDLLLMDDNGKDLYEKIKKSNSLQEKSYFSPFLGGGLEVKATCGSIPVQSVCNKKGIKRPGLGDQRITCLKGYDWKAHHRLTNNLIGITWDFINSLPHITSIQFSSDLNEESWGEIVQPKSDGGRTTSVSIMSREGILKMYRGWILMLNDERYVEFFRRFNKS